MFCCSTLFNFILLLFLTGSQRFLATDSVSVPTKTEGGTIPTALPLFSRYRFIGSRSQFLKFRSWYRLADSMSSVKLSFDFRTKMPNSMLMYMDDGGNTDFIAITLVKGIVELRFKFGRPASVVARVGTNLNNHRWHRLSLHKNRFSLTVTVDGVAVTETVTGTGRANFLPQSFTYFGGLPKTYRLQSLSLPSIYYKPKFNGDMQRITMNNIVVSHMDRAGVKEEIPNRPCSKHRNPCMNGGRCYVRKGKMACDCSRIMYSGTYCEERSSEGMLYHTLCMWWNLLTTSCLCMSMLTLALT